MRPIALLLAFALAGCADAPQGAGEAQIIQTTDLGADRILAEAALCRYSAVKRSLGGGAAATVTIIRPARADSRYRCLVDAMAARAEDVSRP